MNFQTHTSAILYKKNIPEYGTINKNVCAQCAQPTAFNKNYQEKIDEKVSFVYFTRAVCRLECMMDKNNDLQANLGQLHTTELGVMRIRRNLSLDVEDVVGWCRRKSASNDAVITRKGKNWYVNVDNCIITINAFSYTIITAQRDKKN